MAKNGATRRVMVDVDRVTFGVEIECALPDSFILERGIEIGRYHQGRLLPAPFPKGGWTAQHDISVMTDRDNYTPLEIVSPVLTGTAGLEQVAEVFAVLNAVRAEVNLSCGFHVHVGVRSVLGDRADDERIVVRWVRRMLNLVSQHEMALLAITGRTSRKDNNFCKSIRSKWAGKLITTSSMESIRSETVSHNDRYYTVNLCNLHNMLGSKRTVEFRLFGSTLDVAQAIGYIVLALGIARRAAEVGTAPAFNDQPVELTLETCNALVTDLQKTFLPYGWPTGAQKIFGKAVHKQQMVAAEKFAADLVWGVRE